MDFFYLILAAVFGLIVGSFLNVVILRLPQDNASIVFPASHCPHCKYTLRWHDNIPLLSYLILGGRCRNCAQHIAWQYPLVEASTALLSVLLMRQFGPGLSYLYYFIFGASLVVITCIDIQHQIIPDELSLPGIMLGFLGSWFIPQITWQQSLLGIVVGGGILHAVASAYSLVAKREGMGDGDIKLLAMIGAFLGWQSIGFIIFFSSLSGSIIGLAIMFHQKKTGQIKIPFGPFLAGAAFFYLFFQETIQTIWRMYLNLNFS